MMPNSSSRARSIAASLIVLSACRGHDAPTPAAVPSWLLERAAQERSAAARSTVVHDFQFTDRRVESGITFVNTIVDDAGKDYKVMHYDHGSGVCAADVDGDGLPDIYLVTQLGSNELWKNLGGGRFANITDSAGLRMPNAVAVGCSFADIDNDGLPDLFVTTVRHGNRLFRNEGGGKFRDITADAGVGYSGHSAGAVFFDYDNDGLLDLFVANVGAYTTEEKGPGGYYIGLRDAFHGHMYPERAEASILYHNIGGGRFADVTQETRLVDYSWSGDGVIMDVNDDGFPDLYLLDMQGANHLWVNQHGKSFRDETSQYFPRTPWGAMGAKPFDFDGDGRLDLFVTDMHSDMFVDLAPGDWAGEARKSDPRRAPELFGGVQPSAMFGNALFANRGAGKFEEVSDSAGVEMYWPWGPSVDDINADGWDDIFVAASMNFPFRYSTNSVLLNEANRHFLPSEFTLGVEPRAGGVTEQVWFTLDCNGADSRHLYCTDVCKGPEAAAKGCRDDGGGKFRVMGARGTRSAVIVDIDGDGDLDIITNDFNGPPQVLVSDLAAKHKVNSIKVRLRGHRSNREGLGALVTLVLPDGRRILKPMDGKSGYLSLSDLPLYFGLGTADHAASLEVRWPSGARQTVAGPIKSNTTVDVAEP